MRKPDLTETQLNQLREFASQHGRKWKGLLMEEFWARGRPVDGFDTLYRLRNTHGPSWLLAFRFPV